MARRGPIRSPRLASTWRVCGALLLLHAGAACSDSAPDDGSDPAGQGAGGTAGRAGEAGIAGTAARAGTSGRAGSSGGSSAGSGGRTGSAGTNAGTSADPSDAAAGTDGAAGSDAATPDAGPTGTPYVYVSGSGDEITRFTLDLDSGALTERGRTDGGNNPSYLAFAPDRSALYAINEGGDESQVIAFAIDSATGALTEINRQPTMGKGAPHLAVHPSGNYVAVAHYGSGHVSVLPVRADGGLEPASDVERGPSDDCRKAHQAVFDRSGQHLFVPCLESNYVLQFDFAAGELEYNAPATAAVPGGPRHMAFSPDERHAYVLSELESKLTSFDYDAATGLLANPETINSYEQSPGASAHIAVHPSGDFLYVSNRGENSIGLFSIDGDGRPHPVAFVREMIATPRDFTVDPTGTFLISANQSGAQNLLVFRIDPEDGMLTRVQVVAVGGNPTFAGVVFLP